jgi:outer membrane protein assembly factor BamA
VAFTPNSLQAQQNEIPPASEDVPASTEAAAEGPRIVEGRPRFYNLKRVAHPVSWLEMGISPVLRLAEKFAPKEAKEKKPPKESGIKFGMKGLGAGSGFGPQVKLFHNNLLNRGIEFEVPAVITYKFYQSVGFRANYPLMSGMDKDRIGFEVTGDYVSRPTDAFFGLGNDSSLANETRFRTVSRSAAAAIEGRSHRLSVRLQSGFRSIGVTEPRKYRSAQDVFQGQDIPGLTTGATMISTTASIQRNTTDHPDLPASGGIQRLEVSLNEAKTGGDFSYWRYGLELQQFLPLSDDRRKVLGVRASLETNQPKGGSTVPFFDLPTIGSRTTVRGFSTRRFTDRSAMSAGVEYRYRIWRYFDWGLFVDAGQVAPEIGNFALDRFHTGYGIRFIPRSADGRGIMVDVARSREMWMLYIDFSALF